MSKFKVQYSNKEPFPQGKGVKPETEIPNQVRDDTMPRRHSCCHAELGSASGFKRNGFTLIEVVVAVAILGIALTVIIQLFAGGLRLARASKEYTKAVNYANAKMEEINSNKTLEEGVTEGEFDDSFHWRVTMNKVNLLPPVDNSSNPLEVKPPIQLFQIKVDVIWKPGSNERSASVETYRALKIHDEEKKS